MKPLSSNSLTIIDTEMMPLNLCKHRTDTTETLKILEVLGKLYRLAGQYKVSFPSLFLFLSVEHFHVIL